MTEQKHTPEPWPAFTDICQPATPHPESPAIAILSWDDYIRARACVNACAELDTEKLEHQNANGVPLWLFVKQVIEQSDQLRAALEVLLCDCEEAEYMTGREREEYARAALAATE